jgi:hypothetical protein
LKYPRSEDDKLAFSSEALRICLEFIYDGHIFLKDVPFLILFEISTFADQLHLEDLKKKALSYIESFQTNATTKISHNDLCEVFCHENCDPYMKLNVTKLMVKKIDQPSYLHWVHLLAQFDITREEAPEVWETLEKILHKDAYGSYLVFRKSKEENELSLNRLLKEKSEENESNIQKLKEKFEENEAMKKEMELLKHQFMKE